MRSALALAILITVVIAGLALYAQRFNYQITMEPDQAALPFLVRIDRLTGAVERFDYSRGVWNDYPLSP